MNETELLESMHMNTISDSEGKQHLMSVPITLDVTSEQKESLSSAKRVALKCSEVGEEVLAVIEEPVFYDNRKEEISARTFGCQSKKHPKIERIFG